MVTLPSEGVTEHGKVTPRRDAIPSVVSSFQETETVSVRHLPEGSLPTLRRPAIFYLLPPTQAAMVAGSGAECRCLGLCALLLLMTHFPGAGGGEGAGRTQQKRLMRSSLGPKLW